MPVHYCSNLECRPPFLFVGPSAALSIIADPQVWALCVTLAAVFWVLLGRMIANRASWLEVSLELSRDALRVSYPRCKQSPELVIPWSDVGEVLALSPEPMGDLVMIFVRNEKLQGQIQRSMRASFGSGFWLGSPWVSDDTLSGLRILSSTPPAAEVCGLVLEWRNKSLRPATSITTASEVPESPTASRTESAPEPDNPAEVPSEWRNQIKAICALYPGDDLLVGTVIPVGKMSAALQAFPLPERERPVALIVTTPSGHVDRGMLIGSSGIGWRNIGENAKCLRWEQVDRIARTAGDGRYVTIGHSFLFSLSDSRYDLGRAEKLLSELSAAHRVRFKVVTAARPVTATRPRGQVDIGAATYGELLSLPGIGPAEAKLILQHRGHGGIDSLDRLAVLLEMKPHMVERLRGRVLFAQRPSMEQSAPYRRSVKRRTRNPHQLCVGLAVESSIEL